MRFTGLVLDVEFVHAQLKYQCKTCATEGVKKLCVPCQRLSSLYANTLDNPHSSIVMFPPRLYASLFNVSSPVTFFDVLIGYAAVFDMIKACCNPTSSYKHDDPQWREGAALSRALAWSLLQGMMSTIPARMQLLIPRKEDLRPSRLGYIQLAEEIVMYGMSVMKVVNMKGMNKGDPKSVHELVLKTLEAHTKTFGSTMIVPWKREWARSEGDCIEDTFKQNDEWNTTQYCMARDRTLKEIGALGLKQL